MTDSPQSKVGPNPSGLWLPPKERAQTSATSKANQHSLLTDTTGLEKVNRILSSSYLTEQQCSLFCNKTASLSNASTSSPTLCWPIPTKLTRPWQRRFCITNSTAPRWSNETDALKVVILLLILALCFLLFLGVRAQAQETNDQVVLVFDRIENGKIILTPKVGVYFTVKADNFVPLKRGDFIICRERTLDTTDERGSVHHTIVFKCGVDTLTVHGIGLLQDSKDVKRAQREEKDEKAPSPKFNKKTKTYSCPPTWGVSSEDEVRCRKAR